MAALLTALFGDLLTSLDAASTAGRLWQITADTAVFGVAAAPPLPPAASTRTAAFWLPLIVPSPLLPRTLALSVGIVALRALYRTHITRRFVVPRLGLILSPGDSATVGLLLEHPLHAALAVAHVHILANQTMSLPGALRLVATRLRETPVLRGWALTNVVVIVHCYLLSPLAPRVSLAGAFGSNDEVVGGGGDPYQVGPHPGSRAPQTSPAASQSLGARAASAMSWLLRTALWGAGRRAFACAFAAAVVAPRESVTGDWLEDVLRVWELLAQMRTVTVGGDVDGGTTRFGLLLFRNELRCVLCRGVVSAFVTTTALVVLRKALIWVPR